MAKFIEKCDKRLEMRIPLSLYKSLEYMASQNKLTTSEYIRKILKKVVYNYGNTRSDINDKL